MAEIKKITFKAKRKDNGEEIIGSSIFTIENDIGERLTFMLQRGERLFLPVYIDESGNAIQVTGNLYQIDPSTLTFDIEAEGVDEV